MQKDYLKKYYLCENRVLLTVAKTTNIVNKADKLHCLTPTTMAVLGRMLTMSAISSSKLKNENSNITAILLGDGPVGRVVTVARNGGFIKGYIDNPNVDLMPNSKNKIDVSGAVGKGKLRVIADYGFNAPYSGEVDLVSGEIAEDFTHYYATSLQQPSAIALGVLVGVNGVCESAGGFLIEVLPDAREEDICNIEKIIEGLSDISKTLKDVSIEDFVDKYFSTLSPIEYETIYPELKCDCSKSKMKKVVKSLGNTEIEKIFDEIGKLEICCDFCGKKIQFNREELLNNCKK